MTMRWGVLMAVALLPAAAGAQELTELPPSRAQALAAPSPEDLAALPEEEGLLSADALDELVAPVALYPDSLLTQVLVAATYPLDVMKADRFLEENADLPDGERADLVDGEDWDESVRVLAAGFPDVLTRMADDIDWTEEIGDAMLAQTDDLLDAVQRMRAQAEAAGNLESNEAQTVDVAGDNISIAPADPQMVYVPAYDPQTVYTTPVTQPTVVYDDPGVSYGSVLTTGAIAFGSALLIDEIFDDDDDWDDYWDNDSIDWDDDAIYPGRDVDIDGDVNIEVDGEEVKIGDGDLQERREDRWEANRERRDDARQNIAKRQDQRSADRGGRQDDRAAQRGERQDDRAGQRDERQGDRAGQRDARATDRAERREDRPGIEGGGAGTRDSRRTQAEAKLKARSDGQGGGNLKPAADRRPASADRPRPKSDSALKPGGSGRSHVAKATNRGATSLKRDASPGSAKARAPSVSRPKAASRPKTVSRPKTTTARSKAPPRKPSASKSAFKKPQMSRSRSGAAKSRGSRSGGGRRR
jgi:hypothetical protein